MIIGVIGATSNIAGKAYLPVYAAAQKEQRFILYSRNWEKAEEVRKKYKFEYATTDLSALETVDLVMIHAATSEHFALAKRYIEAGVHVYMDKPVSENLAEVKALMKLAEEKEVLFVIGFNRRFAPLTDQLKSLPNKNTVKATKNLMHHKGDAQFLLYDVFIHPLDTMIYLLDDEIESVQTSVKLDAEGKLSRVNVLVDTKTATGLASMNLDSGAVNEEFIVESPDESRKLSELTQLELMTGIDKSVKGMNGWNPATYNRGFDDIFKGLTAAVENYQPEQRAELLEGLKQKNILTSHEIIDEILKKIK
ncbi:Gfo/Idh/MocA family protein [Lactococcus termiticola]|uniref:Oxidoreductase n=1 Tax=Lactococcus termiticola TaxID=2169526 RepID=A0A2R5HFD3_9LACT|nr:Gfo/Idh/MocA family oxidoreductase [Lactococcus termiticola]GBG96744.1 oxidoreductase [Lactococcus termiticola]